VRVLGTTFMVSRYAADTATLIAVRDGKVTVREDGMGAVVLTAARLAVIGSGTMRVAPINDLHLNLKRGNMNPMLLLYGLTTMAGATPTVPVHADLRAVADSDPVLTADGINRMTTFWTIEKKEKEDSIATGQQIPGVWSQAPEGFQFASMVKIAAKFPSVAAHLQQAGLTAKQYDDDAVAMESALRAAYTKELIEKDTMATTAGTAVQSANLLMLKDHWDEIEHMEFSWWDSRYNTQGLQKMFKLKLHYRSADSIGSRFSH
jgi:hypothetical protein